MNNVLPSRPSDGHKGTFGTVLVLAGTDNNDQFMAGGAILACEAALRSGAGLIKLLSEDNVLTTVEQALPQIVGVKNYEILDIHTLNACVVGPAWDIHERHSQLLQRVLRDNIPTIIDAGALTILAEQTEILQYIHETCILTPHPKEAAQLCTALNLSVDPLQPSQQADAARQLARALNCVVVLKSNTTTVADPQKSETLETGNAALATGGSGDILAGLIAGFVAQWHPKHLSVFDCAKWGVIIHGEAAQRWGKIHGDAGLIHRELLELIPATINAHRKDAHHL